MAFVVADRVKETSASTTTGDFALAGAMTGFKTFASRCTVGDTLYYAIQAVDGLGSPTGEWECGLGTYSAANTLTRTTVTSSSNADALVPFSSGTKQVFLSLVADQLVSRTKRNLFLGAQAISPASLTSSASIAVDAALSCNFKLVLAHNTTLANPTNLIDGQVLNVRIKQDATGTRTMAFGTKYKFPIGASKVLSTAANSVDFLSGYYDSTDDTIACNLSKGYA